MTQDEIIRMAYAAGAVKGEHTVLNHQWFELTQEQLERFAALVAEATKEKAAKLCEERDKEYGSLNGQILAAAIRSMK